MDMGKKGVRINAVCPTLVRTGMPTDMMDYQYLLAKFAERIRWDAFANLRRSHLSLPFWRAMIPAS
jgi:NAD(P)-dependent dehydrogenase (short-subunit alcohol dehydrogenase family)